MLAAARSLQSRGAQSVLVTLGEEGSMLLSADGAVLEQAALPIPGGEMVDATGAGDACAAHDLPQSPLATISRNLPWPRPWDTHARTHRLLSMGGEGR